MLWPDAPGSLDESENFFKTPIFIQNFNQVSYLKKQIAWLLGGGYKNICIIDNHSSYAPLLRFYSELEAIGEVMVVRRNDNGSRTCLWDEQLLQRFGVSGPFVYTDSDIIPDACCPTDVIGWLAKQLREHNAIFKVGLGLRIDNLPESYRLRDKVVTWERQYWRAPVCSGLFLSPIDTTFALYRPGSTFAMSPALRTGWPYLARHETWYQDSAKLSEEQRFYVAQIEKGSRSNWARKELRAELQHAIDQHAVHCNLNLVHLSCGRNIMQGWINLDRDSTTEADIVFDLETCAWTRLPIDDASIDGFFMPHAFQQIDAKVPMMQELYRVAKPGARFIIRLPTGAATNTVDDCRYLPECLRLFAQPARTCAHEDYTADWETKRIKLIVKEALSSEQSEDAMLARINREPTLIREMIVELRAVKPPRPAESKPFVLPKPIVSRTVLDIESNFQV